MDAEGKYQTHGLAALYREKCWVLYQLITLPDGRTDKVPKALSGHNAKPNDPSTWSTFPEADAARKHFSGVGVMFADKVLGVDLDHCIVDGAVSPEITEFIEKAHTYTEISPSGTGLHVYFLLTGPVTLERNKAPRGKGADYECYTTGRWFTYTENPWTTSYSLRTVNPDEALELLRMLGYPWKKQPSSPEKAQNVPVKTLPLTDAQLLQRMFASKNGAKIRALYDGDTSDYGNDKSSADAALCSHLAFWTGRDASRIESLWLASPLGAREKTQDREDYRKRTIESALGLVAETYSGPEEDGDDSADSLRTTQATQLVQHVTNNPDIVLFVDDYKMAHIRLPVGDHFEIWTCGGSDFTYWLSDEFYRLTGKAAGTNTISAALNTIKGRARAGGIKHHLHSRIAGHDGATWYDLCDEKWRAIRIDQSGWNVVDIPPILFSRYSFHKPQVEPVGGGDVREILKFVNVQDSDDQILLLVYLVSTFIPGFPHPILYVHGPAGSRKSTLCEVLLKFVSPSSLGVIHFTKNTEELKQTLYHHSAFVCLDNVTGIDSECADLLCRAVTGSGFTKRKLYSDTDAVIFRIEANIAINGVNLGSSREDLLDRCLLLGLERIPDSERKELADVFTSLDTARPRIFGAILNAVSRAMAIKPTVRTDNLFRMADFTAWGCAIAEAIGYSQQSFLDAYSRNIGEQIEEVIESNIVATLIIELMCDDETVEWTGTPTMLFEEIKRLAFNRIPLQTSEGATLYERRQIEKKLPENANALTRLMRHLAPVLEKKGIKWERDNTGKERRIVIRRLDGRAGTNTPF
ncbi:hypothetical protein COU18_03275 [Candidatus Kaiserbacteria bacterium CG10_big_fil_rev_8_21_14_0_10_51_14]|uniref:NrS-1 polymerase-like HBD domain-containing protein n=1 Tax=Candidatus Kaiserbacteria bacterium CG10_big_fil_rev_8_21_14_0_10_51_14 TaxID=1974610 RepID=A0A2H0UD12_9BACT|nr:MAG: hypothetical protein COU18_03275 [Candidatus Kaiserbacteria bacterium CG10_big_fil_rev_8_21_14_0_10_51_14]